MSRVDPFVMQVERDIHKAARSGCAVNALYLGPDGEAGLLEANLSGPSPHIDILPELRIHGVPVRVHQKIPGGRFLYLLSAA